MNTNDVLNKLIAEIERRIDSWSIRGKNSPVGQGKDTCESRVTELSDILSFITSLQQEQPMPSCKSCGFYENNCPFIRGKFIPYPNKVCKDYTYSVMKEQPEVDIVPLQEEKMVCYINYCLQREDDDCNCPNCGKYVTGLRLFPYYYDRENNDVYFASVCPECGKLIISKE